MAFRLVDAQGYMCACSYYYLDGDQPQSQTKQKSTKCKRGSETVLADNFCFWAYIAIDKLYLTFPQDWINDHYKVSNKCVSKTLDIICHPES